MGLFIVLIDTEKQVKLFLLLQFWSCLDIKLLYYSNKCIVLSYNNVLYFNENPSNPMLF